MGRQGILPIGNDWLSVNQILSSMHYLGPINRGFPYRDEFGVLVLANPSSRRLPASRWLELVRWVLVWDEKRRFAAVETSLPFSTRDATRGDDYRQLLGSLRRAHRGAVSRIKLAVGSDLAPSQDAAKRKRQMDERRQSGSG